MESCWSLSQINAWENTDIISEQILQPFPRNWLETLQAGFQNSFSVLFCYISDGQANFTDLDACYLSFISVTHHMMYSAYKLNKQGDNIQPWSTPFPIWNQSTCKHTYIFFQGIRYSKLCTWKTEELWTEVHNIIQEAVNKTIPKKKKSRNAKEELCVLNPKKYLIQKQLKNYRKCRKETRVNGLKT